MNPFAFRPVATAAPKEVFNPPKPVKTDAMCEVDGCYDMKAPGQNHVCLKHQRSS